MSLRLGLIFAMGVVSATNIARFREMQALGPIESMGAVYVAAAIWVFAGGDGCTSRGAYILTGVMMAWVGLGVPVTALRPLESVRTSLVVRLAPGSQFPVLWGIGGMLLSTLQLPSRVRLFASAWVLTTAHLVYFVAYTRLLGEAGLEEKIIGISLRSILPFATSMIVTGLTKALLRPCAVVADALHEEVGEPADSVGERRRRME